MTDTLFYDGRCSLCASEIRLLERLKSDNLTLIDIHSDSFSVMAGADRNQMLAILHLQKSDGTWLKGLDATVAAWRHTRFGWLLSPLRWFGIRSIADRIYSNWASKRACRLGYSESKATQT